MAQFKYIGTYTKPNGKVDVKIGSPNYTWYIEFLDVEPNVDILDVSDPKQIANLQGHKNIITGQLDFEEQ